MNYEELSIIMTGGNAPEGASIPEDEFDRIADGQISREMLTWFLDMIDEDLEWLPEGMTKAAADMTDREKAAIYYTRLWSIKALADAMREVFPKEG